MHILPPVTAEGYDGSHQLRCAECALGVKCDSFLKLLVSIKALGVCVCVLTIYHTIPSFKEYGEIAVEITVGKGEHAGNQHFHHFPQCSLPYQRQI